jgi:3-phosphoshikimate 1-carboxyvinyltransferase
MRPGAHLDFGGAPMRGAVQRTIAPRRADHDLDVAGGAGELRHKASDRIAGIAAGLSALGARVEVDGDDLVIHGRTELHGATTDSFDDHRLAMTFAVAGLVATDRTFIERAASAATSYPGFFADLEGVRA